MLQNDDAAPLSKEAQLTHGIFKLGLIVDDLDKTLSALKARNVKVAFGPFPARENAMSNFIITDNAGNLIQFFGK